MNTKPRADVKALADKYFLKTADTLPRPSAAHQQPGGVQRPAQRQAAPPPMPAPSPAAPPIGHNQPKFERQAKWSKSKTDVFNLLKPAALSIVATDGPVSVVVWGRNGEPEKRFGHNRGIWPARVAKTRTWRDGATSTWDRNPFFFVGTQLRFWLWDAEHRDRLAEAVTARMGEIDEAERESGAATLGHEFKNLGADLDLAFFELEIRDMAARMSLAVWNDDEFDAWLDKVHAMAIAMQNRNGLTARLVDAAALRVLETKGGRVK